ncbi:MAG: hypothetical protein F4Z40_03640, partial [Chloroflexi bacterium]|nr:hypothetical protein [Chloroflexota bacterium]
MIEPRDGNDDPTGLLAEADAIRYGPQDYIPEAWRRRKPGPKPQKNGGGSAKLPPAEPPGEPARSRDKGRVTVNGSAMGSGRDTDEDTVTPPTCAVTSCERPAFIPKRRGRQLGLCSMHQQTSYQIAKRCSLTWPPP